MIAPMTEGANVAHPVSNHALTASGLGIAALMQSFREGRNRMYPAWEYEIAGGTHYFQTFGKDYTALRSATIVGENVNLAPPGTQFREAPRLKLSCSAPVSAALAPALNSKLISIRDILDTPKNGRRERVIAFVPELPQCDCACPFSFWRERNTFDSAVSTNPRHYAYATLMHFTAGSKNMNRAVSLENAAGHMWLEFIVQAFFPANGGKAQRGVVAPLQEFVTSLGINWFGSPSTFMRTCTALRTSFRDAINEIHNASLSGESCYICSNHEDE